MKCLKKLKMNYIYIGNAKILNKIKEQNEMFKKTENELHRQIKDF